MHPALTQKPVDHLRAISDVDDLAKLSVEYKSRHTLRAYNSSSWRTGATNFRLLNKAGSVDTLCATITQAYDTPLGHRKGLLALRLCCPHPHL
jgi:hypothetical protein